MVLAEAVFINVFHLLFIFIRRILHFSFIILVFFPDQMLSYMQWLSFSILLSQLYQGINVVHVNQLDLYV